MYEIYLYTCQISDKLYVGKTRQGLVKRDKQHMYDVRTGSTKLFHVAVRKHGRQRFTLEVLQGDIETLKEANERETFWIAYLKATDKSVGYNITLGGDGVDDPTGEAYRKIAAATKRYMSVPENNGSFRQDVPTSEVVRLRKEGVLIRDIATRFNVSDSCIYRRLNKHSIPLTKNMKNQDTEIGRLYRDEEYTTPEVASLLGISTGKVHSSLNRQGISLRNPGVQPRLNKMKLERAEKTCPACKETKPLIADYYVNSRSLDGYSYQCKKCERNELARNRKKRKNTSTVQQVAQFQPVEAFA